MFIPLTKAQEQQIIERFDDAPRVCLDELLRLREVVKQLADVINEPAAYINPQELLYRLKVEGIDTGVPFKNSGSGRFAPRPARKVPSYQMDASK